METLAAGGVQSICPLNSFHCIIIKLCDIACWHNLLAKYKNQPDPIKHFGVMDLELAKIAHVRSATQMFFTGSSTNLVTMFENEPHFMKFLGIMAL